jgi:parallel beta-helix repeat protein
MDTATRNRIPTHQLHVGDYLWNTTILCLQVWNGFLWQNICGGGGGATKRGETEITVGNVPAGDTPADCDFLDIGNGVGIAAALASVPAIGAHVYVRRGQYNLLNTVLVPANTDFQGAGAGSVLVAPAGGPAIRMVGQSSSVRGFKVEGILVTASSCVVEKNTVTGSHFSGITLDHVNFCTVEGNHVLNSASHGILLINDSNMNLVLSNIVRANAGQGIMVNAPTENDNLLEANILNGNAAPQLTNNGTMTEMIHIKMV